MAEETETDPVPIWIVLPTYCEAENIAAVIRGLENTDKALNILVVDDNSPDGTAAIVRGISDEESRVHLIERDRKTSLGKAYLTGFEEALDRGAEVVVTMDADLSHDPASVPSLIDMLGDRGCVVGSRYIPGGEIVNWPLNRRLLSAAANWFVRLLFGMPVKDCTSGFRVYRAAVIRDILAANVHSHGYSFQVEALKIAVDSGLGVVESPIRFVERVKGTSKMGIREVVDGVRSLTALRLDARGRRLKR